MLDAEPKLLRPEGAETQKTFSRQHAGTKLRDIPEKTELSQITGR